MRLFLAIELSDAVRSHLVELQRTLKPIALDLNWVRPENLHLTLKFLGDAPDTAVPALAKALQNIKPENAVQLSVTHIQCFPPTGPVRIVAAGMPPAPALMQFQKEIDEACFAAGFPREARPWTPHITLARARIRTLPPSMRARLSAKPGQLPSPSMGPDRFVLMESRLDKSGPAYMVAASFPFW